MYPIRAILAAAAAAVLFSTTSIAAGFEPWTYRQNFEIRDNAGWSSYPPIQDAAYEAPFIHPGAVVPGEKGTVLVKIISPGWDSPQLTGAVKRLPCASTVPAASGSACMSRPRSRRHGSP